LPAVGDKLGGVIPFVCPKFQASGRSGGMTIHHVRCCAPFGVAIGLRIPRHPVSCYENIRSVIPEYPVN